MSTSANLHVCAYLCPATYNGLPLSRPHQVCPFVPISVIPHLWVCISQPANNDHLCLSVPPNICALQIPPVCVNPFPSNSVHLRQLCPACSARLRLSLPDQLFLFVSNFAPTPLTVYVYQWNVNVCVSLCSANNVRLRLTLPRLLKPFASISAPPILHYL